jgi:hypothetical protein
MDDLSLLKGKPFESHLHNDFRSNIRTAQPEGEKIGMQQPSIKSIWIASA